MKCMISQPMNGKTEKQIRADREKIVNELENNGWEVIDTIFTDEPPKGSNPGVWYLAKSIDAISKVDAVLFMNYWHTTRGCIMEHEICLRYDIPTMYEYEL